MKLFTIDATDLPDLWFQAVYNLLEVGRSFTIDRGSYAGQIRLEYDYFIGHVKFPKSLPILPQIPQGLGIPDPVDYDYVYGGPAYERSYIEYLMTPVKQPGESYTYGERLTAARIGDEKRMWYMAGLHDIVNLCRSDNGIDGTIFYENDDGIFMNQIEYAIDTYRKHGYRNNQIVLQVAHPTDMFLKDPPCLRSIDTRIQDGVLSFVVYFRSWDLWGGFPANLAAIQYLKEYMADAIGVADGDMIVESKGLHIYGYAEHLARLRCLRDC